MPDVVDPGRSPGQQVSLDPRYGGSPRTEPATRAVECECGHVEDGDVIEAVVEQLVDERGAAAADVEDRMRRHLVQGIEQFP